MLESTVVLDIVYNSSPIFRPADGSSGFQHGLTFRRRAFLQPHYTAWTIEGQSPWSQTNAYRAIYPAIEAVTRDVLNVVAAKVVGVEYPVPGLFCCYREDCRLDLQH